MTRLGPDKREGYKEVETVEGYDKWAPTYDEQRNPLIAIEEKITLNFIGNVKNQKVLDIGCGTGRYCKLLADRGAKVVGIDPSARMLEYAKRKITHDCKFELRLERIEDAEFPTGHFNVVVCALTLGHIPELEPVIKKLSHTIKSRGRLIISDIHPYWPISGHDYAEFFDKSGQEYRIPEYAHLVEEYWNLLRRFKFYIGDIKEPKIDDRLIEAFPEFPELKEWKGVPLALILKAIKE
jgi:2-polyprenyl-3-methyl-5-hydroxy-6-metoxy-1,4-benzoquinol methylase